MCKQDGLEKAHLEDGSSGPMLTMPKKFENIALSLGAVRPTVYTNPT